MKNRATLLWEEPDEFGEFLKRAIRVGHIGSLLGSKTYATAFDDKDKAFIDHVWIL